MIKENKKNKIITYLCACLMVCASALGLVNAVGTTLASSPTQPTITAENFTNYALYNNYDYVLQAYVGTNTTGKIIGSNVPDAFSGVATSYSAYSYSSNTVTDITSQITKFEFFKYFTNQYFKITYANNAGSTFLAQTYFIVVAEYNGVYYYCISNTMNTYRTIYNQGLADADTTSAYNNGYNTGYSEGQTNGYNTGVTQGQNNVINNPNNYDLYTQAQYQQNYTNGYNTGVTQGQNNVINNPNAYGLYTQAQYNQNYTDGYNAGLIQGQNNVINNPNDFGLNTNQQLQDSYNQGFADGEQSTDAYQNGYDIGFTDGSNEVINNPNNYDLYTQAQYEQNYEDGFNQGVLSAQYGVFANVRITGGFAYQLTDDTIYSVSISNEDFNFANGVITAKQTLIDKYNTFMELLSQQSNVRFKQARIIFNDLNFIYNSDIDINFVNLNSLNDTSTAYFYAFVNNTSNYLFRTYTPVLENGIVVGYNIGNYDNVVDGTLVTEIRYDMLIAPPVVNESVIGNYSLKPNNLLVYEKSIAFDNGYDVGYADGTSSEVVNDAYDKGYTDGNRIGYQTGLSEGLNNPNRYTFLGLLTGVVSAPVNVLKDLFDFDIMGFNMLKFFLGCLTAVLILWLVRKIMGGK